MADNLITINKNTYIFLEQELKMLRQKVVSLENAMKTETEVYDRLLDGIAVATNCLLTIEDYHESVNRALAALGKAINVDRVYIFESHQHPDTKEMLMSQRWEWVADGISPEIDNPQLQNLAYHDFFPRWCDFFARGELVYGLVKTFPQTEQDILNCQNILSICVMPIYIKNQLWGCIGFDDCHTARKWNKLEKTALEAAVGNLGAAIARHETEAKLQESQQLMQLVMDNIPQLIFWKDRNSIFQGCNINAAKAVGMSCPGEIVGKNDYDLSTTTEQSDWYRECDKRVMESGQAELHIIETYQQVEDGKQAWLDTNKIPLRDGNNNIVGILVTIEDITERKLFEERLANLNQELEAKVEERTAALYESEARLQRLTDKIPGMLYECRVDTRGAVSYPYVSSGCREILGLEPKQIQEDAALFLSCIHPDDLPKMKTIHLNSLQNLENWECEWRIIKSDGQEKWVKAIAHPQVQDDDSIIFYTCMVDVSQFKVAQEALQQRANRLRIQNTVLTKLARSQTINQGALEQLARIITINTAKILNVERVSIWLYDEQKTCIKCINLFERSLNKHTQGIKLSVSDYPIYFQAIETENIIAANDAHTDRRTREFSKSYLTSLGITSMLDSIIRSRGKTLGVICVEHTGSNRQWNPEDENFVRSVADIISLAVEVRESKRAEALLVEQEQFLRSIYDGIHHSIFVIDVLNSKEFRCVGMNSFGLQTIGKNINEVVGKNIEDIFDRNTARTIHQKFSMCLETGHAITYEECLRVQEKQTHFLTKINPLRDREGKIYRLISTTLNISDRKSAEIELQKKATELENTITELQRTQTQLIQSEKMSGLGQMVAGIAHEINNPATFIHGNLTYIEKYIQDLFGLLKLYQKYYPQPPVEIQNEIEEIELDFLKEDVAKILRSMEEGTSRIRKIVLSLRNFSRLNESDFKKVDIHEGIESTLMILHNRLKVKPDYPEIKIIKEYAKLPPVECYPGQLNQVFLNILINAIDILEEATLKIQNFTPQIRIFTTLLNNNTVRIGIYDNGYGIPDEITKKIFDPFFTTKDVGKGTGLGLSIGYQIIVDKHGGKLYCQSHPKRGAKFIIEIPVSQSI
ncbi:MAG: PAS domain S-box protein [Cyanobacteria bacterium P01_A01_bin.84]